jgi:2-dehydro-3-deoxyphosphogluconate aldolase / (4S)-4-hydroxy-2-oxoglutarate aldolase
MTPPLSRSRSAQDPLSRIAALRVLPVVTIEKVSDAAPLGDALVAGGLPVAEITLRSPAALAALAALAARSDLLVGAGTVLTVEQLDQAVDAGASFIVSPGLARDVVERAQHYGIPAVPGVATPTEITSALRLGIDTVKLFPAASLGGPRTVAALSAPFGGLKFIPTGGITSADLLDYLKIPSVAAVGGSWMVSSALQREGRWDDVTRLAAEARAAAVSPPSEGASA